MVSVKDFTILFVLFCSLTNTRSQLAAGGGGGNDGEMNGPPPGGKSIRRGDKLQLGGLKEKEQNEVANDNLKQPQQPPPPPPPPAPAPVQENRPPQPGEHGNEAPLPRIPPPAQRPAADLGGPKQEMGQQQVQNAPPPPAVAIGNSLADRPECSFEVSRHCANVPRHNDVQILQCLQDLDERDEVLSERCRHTLWEFKINLTQDERFRKAAEQFCKEDLERSECGKVTQERGHMISCLADLKDTMQDSHCKAYLTRIEAVIFTDFRLVGPFVQACRDDVRKLNCGQLEDERTKIGTEPPQPGPPGQPPQQGQQQGQQQQGQQQQLPPQARLHSQGATLNCMIRKMIETGRGEHELNPKCRHEIIRIAELQADDFHLDRPLYFACRTDREKFCAGVNAGEGRVFRCLAQHRHEFDMSRECQGALDVRLQLMGQDYKISKQLLRGCQNEMRDFKCDFQPQAGYPPPPEHLYLAYLILCLEEAARTMNVTNRFGVECQTQLFEHRRLLMSDYRMDPEVVLACSEDIQTHCGGNLEDGGRTLHCLMGRVQARDGRMNNACKQAINRLMRGADIGSDYRVDRVLYTDCRRLIDAVCEKEATSQQDVLSCLMMNVESPLMTDDCESRLLEVQYFLARDFRLDPQLYQACKDDAASKCGDSGPWAEKAVLPPPPMDPQQQVPPQQQQQQQQQNNPNKQEPGAGRGYLVITCLYRHVYTDDEESKPSPRCTKEVQRVMRERSLNVNLLPHIEDACLKDLAERCSQRTGPGEEIKCLQENLRDLEKACQKAVKEFTEQESMDARLDHALMRACNPVLETYCKDSLDKIVDKGDIMDCLLKNKGVPSMNNKCRLFVNHYELVTMKDYKFTYKFRQSCKRDIEKYCLTEGAATDKASIVGCLSEILVKHALLGEQEELAKECRKQLRAEYFSMETLEAKISEPKLVDACQTDITRYCNQAANAGAALECLREHKPELEPRCRKYVFRKERLQFEDNSFDMTLNRVCADEIRTLCAHEQPERVFHCLKTKIERQGVQKSFECLDLIRRRKHEQAGDIRLQPVLARACKEDINTLCKKELETIEKKQDEAEGVVISCLRRHATQPRTGVIISASCQVEVRRIIYDSEVDPSLDPPFYHQCKEEIMDKCSKLLMDKEGHESLLECMKVTYKKNLISKKACKEELARKINEELADIHLDPDLNAACATDLQRYCDIKPGDGKLLNCLLTASSSGNVQLSQQCHAELLERRELWRHVKQDHLPINLPSDVGAVVQALYASPARNTLATVLLVIVVIIFAVGLCCGRVTRRVRREMKNR